MQFTVWRNTRRTPGRGYILVKRHLQSRTATAPSGGAVARRPNLFVDGFPIAVTWTDWNLAWFLCPRCSQRCRHIYVPELACRKCLKLDYSSRHRHRSVPGLARLKWLRRLIGADEQPFAPLPERPRHHLRYNRIADEIRALEQGLVGHLSEINRVFERRVRKLK